MDIGEKNTSIIIVSSLLLKDNILKYNVLLHVYIANKCLLNLASIFSLYDEFGCVLFTLEQKKLVKKNISNDSG